MKVAVVLSGCGFLDGAEIHESVLTLLALSKAGVSYQCFAPNIEQHHVVNHLSGEEVRETRNVLVEAARIARGDVADIASADANHYDAVFFPGGFGVAKNLTDFAFKGANCSVQFQILGFAKSMAARHKPACFICIAPAMIPSIYGAGAHLTIGTDRDTAGIIEQMGGVHEICPVRDIIIDKSRKIVSTPAYMLAQSIAEAAEGIEKAVHATLAMVHD